MSFDDIYIFILFKADCVENEQNFAISIFQVSISSVNDFFSLLMNIRKK